MATKKKEAPAIIDNVEALIEKIKAMKEAQKVFATFTQEQVCLLYTSIGAIPKHKKTVEALGLKKMHKTVVLPDNAATRGMVQQVRHLVKVEEEA